jgi:hypothetical protein
VTEVDPIEIADREHAGLALGDRGQAAEDFHGRMQSKAGQRRNLVKL